MRFKLGRKSILILAPAALAIGALLIFPALHLGLTLAGIALWGFSLWAGLRLFGEGKGSPFFSRNELQEHRARPKKSSRFLPWVVLALPLLLFLFQRAQEGKSWLLAAFFLGASVALLGLLERTQAVFDPGPFPKGESRPWVEGSLLLLGGFFLLFKFGQLPCWMDNDCANCMADALYFQHGETTTPFKTVWGDNPALPYMLYGLSFKVFGFSFGAAAGVVALFHLACLPFYRSFCRLFLPAGAAWLSALLFACSRWLLFFVRTPRETSLLPCFEVAALFFFTQAVEKGRKRDHALFGLSLALLLQTYLPSRAVLALFLTVLAILALRRRSWMAQEIPRWGLALGTFLLFLSPLLVWYAAHPEVVLARMKAISILNLVHEVGLRTALDKNFAEGLWIFNVRGGTDDHYNLAGVPFLDPFSGMCFWVGLGWCLSRIRRFPFLFLVLGLLAGLLGMFFGDVPGHPMRSIAAIPFVFLLAGLGADRLGRALCVPFPKARPILLPLALGAVLVSALAWNYDVYFRRMPSNRTFLDANNQYEFLAARSLGPYPKGWDIHMDFDGFMHAYVYTYQRAEMRFFLPDFGLPIKRIPEAGAVVLMDGLGAVVEDLMKDYYPKAKFRRIPYYSGPQALWMWEMTQREIRDGLDRTFPPNGYGIWLRPLGSAGEEGARWWPALFGIQKWQRAWALNERHFTTTFSLSQDRILKVRARGTLRLWVNGVEREGMKALEEDKEWVLDDLPKGAQLRWDYLPEGDLFLLDLYWKEGEGYAPIPSGAYRSERPAHPAVKPKDFEPTQAQILMPYW